MLQSLIVEGLFGIYNYNLSFSTSSEDKIRFITAPNGFGKTTILRFIDALYKRDFQFFFTIPFSSLTFFIDNIPLRIEQIKESSTDENADVDDETFITLVFGSEASSYGHKLKLPDILDKSNDNVNEVINQIDLFFNSEKCVFVDDRRLLRENTDTSELIRFSDLLRKKLNDKDIDLTPQIAVLKRIIERSEFANKRFEIDKAFGFRFVVTDANHTKLPMHALSSGEQHILLQTLYLLFEAPTGTLVLIDEPEMSLHLAWQGDYLQNLKDIVALRDIQCIISTHSPIIFSSEYSLSQDLFDLSGL